MNITGHIIDKTTGESLPGANIYFSAENGVYIPGAIGTYTDGNGNYSINGVGEYITATFTGYQKLTLPASSTVNFALTQGSNLPEVEITARALLPYILTVIVTTIAVIWLLKPFQP